MKQTVTLRRCSKRLAVAAFSARLLPRGWLGGARASSLK
jgi:hypothetical protein